MKKIAVLILTLVIMCCIVLMTPFTAVAENDAVSAQDEDYIYYSDLFYGYSGYLKSNLLMEYNRETYAVMSNVFSEYVKSDAFELAGFLARFFVRLAGEAF